MKLSRQEYHDPPSKRHPMGWTLRRHVTENGYLTAIKARCCMTPERMRHWADRFFSVPVPMRHAYNFQVIDIDGTAVYTNNPPNWRIPGFGVTQTCFGSEMNLNLLAEKVGIIRWRSDTAMRSVRGRCFRTVRLRTRLRSGGDIGSCQGSV